MAIKLGINGFGRIGKLLFRAALADGNFEVVGSNDDSFALVGEGAEELPGVALVADVKVGSGLVEEEDGCLRDKSASDVDALLLAAGEVRDEAVLEVTGVDGF